MPARSLADRLKEAGTSALSDALDRLGIDGQAVGILPVVRTMRFAGPAFTIRMLPVGISGGVVGDYIDDVAAGAVIAIDNNGRLDQTVWGDILTFVASRKGVAGTVIDGVCRDSERCVELNYPVYSRSRTMRTGKDRVTAHEYNVTIQLAGVRVESGDWLAGDADGVVAIPAARANEVADIAEQIEALERQIVEEVSRGQRLDAARKSARYHSLQSRTKN